MRVSVHTINLKTAKSRRPIYGVHHIKQIQGKAATPTALDFDGHYVGWTDDSLVRTLTRPICLLDGKS